MYEADPSYCSIRDTGLLEHLTTLPPLISSNEGTLPNDDLATSLLRLPPEIISCIMKQLHPFTDPPEQCTYVVSPDYWLDALKRHDVLPWLWDLDTAALDEKENQKSAGEMWDWESFVRRLAQGDVYGPGPETKAPVWGQEGLHPRLRNRRRIWKLALDMLDENAESFGKWWNLLRRAGLWAPQYSSSLKWVLICPCLAGEPPLNNICQGYKQSGR